MNRSRQKVIIVLFFISIVTLNLSGPSIAEAEDAPWNPLQQPPPTSPYGMDPFGPSWQWTFPRESAWPRLSGSIRVDHLDELFLKMSMAGVRGARIATWWCILEPERDSYNWEDLDYAFQIASNYGLEPVPEIFYTPDWAVGIETNDECIDSQIRNVVPSDMDDWSDFMAELVGRYGVHGKNQVHAWEIWNEPDLWEFFYYPEDPGKSYVVYADMVKRARMAIDTNDPGGLLLLGGISDIAGPDFLRRLLDLKGSASIRNDIDVVTFHAFSSHGAKIGSVRKVLRERKLDYELWVNELNSWGMEEKVSVDKLNEIYESVEEQDVSRTFWFQSWTTGWGPGIFKDRSPIWNPGPYIPSPFYDSYKSIALTQTLATAPVIVRPANNSLVGDRPVLEWLRPESGTLPIAGYKLQVDDTLYQGTPYFHSPEIDAWVPRTLTHFLPMQLTSGAIQMRSNISEDGSYPTEIPDIDHIRYKPTKLLSPGHYYWRVAAVDTDGNVGPYSTPQKLIIVTGQERNYWPSVGYTNALP